MFIKPVKITISYNCYLDNKKKKPVWSLGDSLSPTCLSRFFYADFRKSFTSTVIDSSYQSELFLDNEMWNVSVFLKEIWRRESRDILFLGVDAPRVTRISEHSYNVAVDFYVDDESLVYLRLLEE